MTKSSEKVLAWWRCRYCGTDFSTTVTQDDVFSSPECPTCWGEGWWHECDLFKLGDADDD